MIDESLLFLAKIASGDDTGLWRLLGVKPADVAALRHAVSHPAHHVASTHASDADVSHPDSIKG
jgi:hypothetical protein